VVGCSLKQIFFSYPYMSQALMQPQATLRQADLLGAAKTLLA